MEKSIRDVIKEQAELRRKRRDNQNIPSKQWWREEYVGLRAWQANAHDNFNRYDWPEDNWWSKSAELLALRQKALANDVNKPKVYTTATIIKPNDMIELQENRDFPWEWRGKRKLKINPNSRIWEVEMQQEINKQNTMEKNNTYHAPVSWYKKQPIYNKEPVKGENTVAKTPIEIVYNPPKQFIEPVYNRKIDFNNLTQPLLKNSSITWKQDYWEVIRWANRWSSEAWKAAMLINNYNDQYNKAKNYVDSKKDVIVTNSDDIKKLNKMLEVIKNYKKN